jgi:hypothetical protein
VLPNVNIIVDWRIPEILWKLCLDLIPLRVRPYRIKVFTNMLCIKVNKCDWVCSVNPDPTENARVDGTHEPLSDNIETVGWEMTLI